LEPRCIDAERISAILDLPPDDVERRHADTCPRCRGLVDSYRAFLAAEPISDSGLDEARRVLDADIRASAERSIPEAHLSTRSFWWRTLLRPAPVLAAAAVVLVATWWATHGPEQSITRGNGPPSQNFVLHTPESRPDGAVALSWSAVEGADRYEVRIYGADLHEIYRSEAATTSLVVPRDALPATSSPDLTWEVRARLGSDVIGVSPPGSIHLL